MPKLSLERAAARRQQILDAALFCFAERGFYKSTMQDVASAAALSIGSLYCHFASKEEVVHALVEARHQGDVEILARALDAPTFDKALDCLGRGFFPSAARPQDQAWRKLAVQLWAATHDDQALSKAVQEGVDRPRRMLEDLLRRASRRGEIAATIKPEPAARILIAVFQGMTLQESWDTTLDPSALVPAIKTLFAKP